LAFVAVSVHVYDLPLVKLLTTSGDSVSDAIPGTPPFEEVQVAS
jgi:hypothetical protein